MNHQGDIDLLNEFQDQHTQRLQDLERRILALEAKAGIVSEGQYGPGKMLVAEGEHVDDPDELVVEDLQDWAGFPLAHSLDGRRPALTQSLAAGFDSFSPGSSPSGQLDTSEAARELSRLIQEGQRRRRQADRDDEPTTRADDVWQPHEFAGVRPARGF